MRRRLRPAHTADDLAKLYAVPHDHTHWPDHVVRVGITIEVGRTLLGGPTDRGADLSCGSGAILAGLDVKERHFGDLAHGHRYHGPIEETVHQIPDVDVFVCCETLEHLDDPDRILKAVRGKTRALLVSTPVDAWNDDNVEHYWAWGRADVDRMLDAAEFTVDVYRALDFRPYGLAYCFGIWGCR